MEVEEATESLLFKNRDVIVIQYVAPSMADDLLIKFPDNSAFDFDYSQSSIWSPLIPRFSSRSGDSGKKRKKIEFDNGCNVFDKIPLRRIGKKMCDLGVSLNEKFGKKKKKMKMMGKVGDDGSELGRSPPSRKGWKKVLKMTSKQFKKKRDHHHHHHHHHYSYSHPISDVTLSDYFQSPNM